MPFEHAQERIAIDGLGQERLRVDPPFAGRRGDDRDGRQVRIVLLVLAEFPAVHHRHHHVEDDGVGPVSRPHHLQRMLAVIRDQDAVIVLFEHGAELFANVAIVLYDQYEVLRLAPYLSGRGT